MVTQGFIVPMEVDAGMGDGVDERCGDGVSAADDARIGMTTGIGEGVAEGVDDG